MGIKMNLKRYLLFTGLCLSLISGCRSDSNTGDDPSQKQPGGDEKLSKNIISGYHLVKSADELKGERYQLLDFSDKTYNRYTDDAYHKDGDRMLKMDYGARNNWMFKEIAHDWSAYKAMSFWLYAPASSVGDSFVITLFSPKPEDSEYCQTIFNEKKCVENYYTWRVTIENEGWTLYNKPFSEFNITREPGGWHDITLMNIDTKGYGQGNRDSTVVYVDNMYLYSDESDLDYSSHLPEMTGVFFAEDAPRSIVGNRLIKNSFRGHEAKVYIKDRVYWVPLSVLAARYDEESTYNEKNKTLNMRLNGHQYRFTGGSDKVFIDGQPQPLDFTVEEKNGALFFPHTYVRDLFGYAREYVDKMGMRVLYNDQLEFSSLKQRLAVMYEMLFVRPTGARVLADMQAHLGGDVHPRVIMRQADFDRLKTLLKTDTTLQEYKSRLEYSFGPSSSRFQGAPVKYEIADGVRLLPVSREVKSRVIIWSLLYKLTEDSQYVQRIWKELTAVFAFPDWHPSHDIDTAEIIHPVALAYDWLYDAWSVEQRQSIEKAMAEFGFPFALEVFAGERKMWPDNNHTNVINGSLTAAALAFANVPAMRAACESLLDNTITNVERSFYAYAPDGGYLEGPGYWAYGTEFQILMNSALETATGTDYNLSAAPGFKKSVYYPINMESDAGIWQLHDSANAYTSTQYLRWFARKNNEPSLIKLRLKDIREMKKAVFYHDILWYDPVDDDSEVTLPLDAYYEQVGIVSTRSSWDAGAMFTGLHGGENYYNNADLDIGTFILYGGGKRFFIDLAPEDFNMWMDGYRFKFYRKRAEGQNTLVIGPVDYNIGDQKELVVSEFLRNEHNENSNIAVVDMAPAYDSVTVGRRGMFFKDKRTTVVFQDEITLDKPEIVRWGAHLPDSVKVNFVNNGRGVDMVDGEARFYCEIVSADTSLAFTYGDAVSYDPDYPVTPGENYHHNNADDYIGAYDIKALRIITPQEVGSFNLAVACRMLKVTDSLPEPGTIYNYSEIDQWQLE